MEVFFTGGCKGRTWCAAAAVCVHVAMGQNSAPGGWGSHSHWANICWAKNTALQPHELFAWKITVSLPHKPFTTLHKGIFNSTDGVYSLQTNQKRRHLHGWASRPSGLRGALIKYLPKDQLPMGRASWNGIRPGKPAKCANCWFCEVPVGWKRWKHVFYPGLQDSFISPAGKKALGDMVTSKSVLLLEPFFFFTNSPSSVLWKTFQRTMLSGL